MVAELVGIERGTDGERKDLARVHILHHHRAAERLRGFHFVVEGALGHELDVFVDGELEVAARFRLALGGTKHLAPRIHGRVHQPRLPVQVAIEFFFKTAEPVVVDAHVAQHLRGNLAVGIKALELLLKIDALHIQGLHGGRHLRRDAARDPGEVVPCVQARGNLVLRGQPIFRIGVHQRGQCARGGRLVGNLGRVGVNGVGQNRHSQLAQVAIVEDAAARSHFKGALLLFLGALHELLMAHDLQPEQAARNGAGPEQKEEADDPEARSLKRQSPFG